MSRRREFPRLTCEDVLDALEQRHSASRNGMIEWAFAREVPTATSYGPNRIDAMAFNCWASKRYLVRAYEVKVSRADFRKEISSPGKSRRAKELAHEFVFAVPKGMIDRDELPDDGSGLVVVDARGRTTEVVKPKRTERDEWPATFLASVIRSAQRTAWVDKARIHDRERARVYAEVLAHHAARDPEAPEPAAGMYDWLRWARRVLGDDTRTVDQAVHLLQLGQGGVDRVGRDRLQLW